MPNFKILALLPNPMEVCLYMSVPYGEIFIELKTLEDLSKDKNPFLPNDIKLFHNKFL